MRVYQLNTFCGVKSTGRITTEIAKLVETDGGACQIGYGAGDIPKDVARFAYRIGTPMERKLHGAIRKLFDGEGYGSQLGTAKLIKQMKAFEPDLIHLHNLHGCYVNLHMLFEYLHSANLPVVWTLHDCWPFTGHCAYFDYSGCNRWQFECHHCPQQRSYPICIGFDGSKRNFLHKKELFTSVPNITFALPCEWMKKPLSMSFLKHYPTRVIPNGVNLTVFQPTHNNIRARYSLSDKPIVLSVASEWDERKGLPFLVEAAKKLGSGYQFVIIGLAQAQIDLLPHGMLGLTHTESTAELAAWYSEASVFANPTMEDNMPMVNLEALACGTPVAVFRTGGCPEAVNEKCGIVVNQGDASALADAIALLCSKKADVQNDCLKQAKAFDSRLTFQAYVDLYKELINQ